MSEIFNPFSLEGKTILVTGASSGIGRAIAVVASKMGAKIVVTGRNQKRLDETCATLTGNGHLSIISDISTKEGITNLVNNLPKLDGMVLAAGIVEMWPVLFATKEKFVKIFDTNLFSPIEIIRLIVKKKKYMSNLSVVVIDSIAGNDDFVVGNGIYGAGKAALKSYIKFCALELVGKGIRLNTVSPGLILTPMQTNGAVGEDELGKAVAKVPMKRWGSPDDVAYAATYLLSDASTYLTGSDIKVDGGYTI